MFCRQSLAWVLAAAVCAPVVVAQSAAGSADEQVRARIEQVFKAGAEGQHIGAVAIAPDGGRVAWTLRHRGGNEILLAPVAKMGESSRVTAGGSGDGGCDESEPTWTPDGKALVFLSDCGSKDGQSEIFESHLDGKPAEKLSKAAGELDSLTIAPDGRSVAFLYVEGATRRAGALAAMKPFAGVIGEDGIEVQRVARVLLPKAGSKAEAQKPEWLTPSTLHVYEFAWRPDAKGLAFVAANPPGENNWWVAKLYSQSLGAEPQVVLAPAEVAGALHGLQIAVPRWSPDGRQIAFIGGLMSDQGATGGDVWLVKAEGGAPVNLTPGRPSTPAWLEWKDARRLFVNEMASGEARLFRIDLEEKNGLVSGEASQPLAIYEGAVGDGRMELSLSATADRGIFAFAGSSFSQAPEIYLAHTDKPGSPEAITRFNASVLRGWGKTSSLKWQHDGFNVQGWLMEPKSFDPAKKYPLIVVVHGGPAADAQSRWGTGMISAPVFSALGYFVLEANPRGSFGQGEAFTQANRKDFGYGDLGDILAGVDAAIARYPIDPKRVGIAGWSYGGFMSMFAVTQTDRFAASVAGAGIANWQSYYGENSIDQWMQPFFGSTVYDDPEVYAKSSAINYIGRVKTPTLVVVGDRDGECPAPQSFEFWHALRAKGVPTKLVIYPNEGHGFVDAGHRRDVIERAAAWFEQYLGAGGK